MTREQDLIRERLEASKTYKVLNETERQNYEQAVSFLVNLVLLNSDRTTIQFGGDDALKESGVDEEINKLKTTISPDLEIKNSGISQTLKRATIDVLLALTHPNPSTTIKDVQKHRYGVRQTYSDEIRPGRVFHTNETQPPTTGARTLRKRRK